MKLQRRLDPSLVDGLLLAQALVLLPHLLHIPLWLPLFWLAIAISVRGALKRGRPLLARGWRLLLVGGVLGGVLLTYRTIAGLDAGVSLLTGMMALKLLEMEGRRDALLLLHLSYFMAVTNFLFDQSILVAVYMFVVVIALTATLALVSQADAARPARLQGVNGLAHWRLRWLPQLRLSARMVALATPVALLLFLLFPRIPGPIWTLPRDPNVAVSGLSGEMSPGDIGTLSQSSAVAFRVAFDGPIPDLQQIYWRGPILWRFDGRSWSAEERPPVPKIDYHAIGEPLSYHVTLEPHGRRWLFAIDVPASIPERAFVTPDYQLISEEPVHELRGYRMRSYLHYRIDPEGPLHWRATRLQGSNNPRSLALAASWREQGLSTRERINELLRRFREEPYVYTLTPPLLGEDSIDEFLFDTRRGFCEHYAGAFVFMMRAAGVPARVVTGYQGGEVNGDYVIVRQSDAHAWAEVWMEGAGWIRIDPTASVAPERIERGLAGALADGEPIPFLSRREDSWLHRAALQWDRVNNLWNRWVLGYGDETQLAFLRQFLPWFASLRGMVTGMVVGGGLLLLGITIWLLRPAARGPQDRVLRQWRIFLGRLQRLGVPVDEYQGPLAIERQIDRHLGQSRPDLMTEARAIVGHYRAVRYEAVASGERERQFVEAVRRFRL